MRFIGLQENLKRGLNIVGHATAKNINLPILNNILIKVEGGNIELVSTNLEIGVVHQVRGKIEKDGQFTVDAKLITEYVNLLNSGEKVKVEVKAEVKPEVKPVAKPEVKVEVKAEVKPEVKPEVKVVEIDLEAKTVAELKDMAKELNLTGYSALRKAELIELIKTAL